MEKGPVIRHGISVWPYLNSVKIYCLMLSGLPMRLDSLTGTWIGLLFLFPVRFLMTIDSALGRYDGNAYQALWERAQQEPLNATEVAEAYEVGFVISRRDEALLFARNQSNLFFCEDKVWP